MGYNFTRVSIIYFFGAGARRRLGGSLALLWDLTLPGPWD
jgi:hypothetical protein